MIGDLVTIDQRYNQTKIKGPGSMRMVSATDPVGKKIKEPKPMIVHWRDGMEFRGTEKWAWFQGGVQARQGTTSSALCEFMQITLDKPVYFNRYEKRDRPTVPQSSKEPAAKIETVVPRPVATERAQG